MCLLEVAMCEKCRSSHFQSEEGGGKNFGLGGLPIWGAVLLLRRSVPYYMPFLIVGVVSGVKGQKMAQNDKKLCLPHSISGTIHSVVFIYGTYV